MNILPFPLVRRRDLVCRLARRCTELSPEAAEGHLRHQIGIQAAALTRKGVPDGRVAAESHALEAAVRVAIWRDVLMPGGAA